MGLARLRGDTGSFVLVSTSASMPWGDFSADPRDATTASLRASDRDRDVVLGVLAEAYADGRLARDEYDERADRATRARTLGELPPIIADLVPQTVPRKADELAVASAEEPHERAVRAYESSRRHALSGLVVTTVTLTAIWLVLSGPGGFYWPVFVIAAGLANLLRVLLNKQDLIDEEQRRLERDQRKSIGPPAGDS